MQYIQLRNKFNSSIRNRTRIVWDIVFVAIASVVVDIDHPIAYALGLNKRFMHETFSICGFLFVFIGIGMVASCVCRYLVFRVLTSKKG